MKTAKSGMMHSMSPSGRYFSKAIFCHSRPICHDLSRPHLLQLNYLISNKTKSTALNDSRAIRRECRVHDNSVLARTRRAYLNEE